MPVAPAKSHEAEHNQADDSQKQNRANAEENLKKGVVDRGVAAGIQGQQLHVLAHPEARQHETHAEQQGDQGGGDGQVELSIGIHPMDFVRRWRLPL